MCHNPATLEVSALLGLMVIYGFLGFVRARVPAGSRGRRTQRVYGAGAGVGIDAEDTPASAPKAVDREDALRSYRSTESNDSLRHNIC